MFDFLQNISIGDFIQNVAIIIASFTAIYGIRAWKKEHIGKRKIDLSEEVLSLIYEIKDVIRFIRSPIGFEGEGSTRKRADFENKEESQIFDSAYVAIERYDKQKDVFNNFYKMKYRYMANFGKFAENPFKIVREVTSEIFNASRMLGSRYWKNQGRREMTDKEISRHLEKMEKYESVFWEIDENDDVNKKIDSAISICEDICKSANKLGFWNFNK
ncbi:MAG TPA: hypothetical protein VIK14_06920 [Ignavibacteria bacterium]